MIAKLARPVGLEQGMVLPVADQVDPNELSRTGLFSRSKLCISRTVWWLRSVVRRLRREIFWRRLVGSAHVLGRGGMLHLRVQHLEHRVIQRVGLGLDQPFDIGKSLPCHAGVVPGL